MSNFLSSISVFFIPLLISIIILFAAKKKAPLYDLFIKGAKNGIKTSIDLLPFLIGIFIAIEALTSSGAIRWLEKIIEPLFKLLGMPEELTGLALLRPISGSGSLVMVQQLMEEHGPDSFIGRTACVMAGSCETVFYVLALYFGVTAVKKMRHSATVGVIGYIAAVIASAAVCRFF